MREIEFRGLRTDNGRWAYGQYVKTPITTEFDCEGQFLDSGVGRHCIIQNGVAHEIDIETLGQYVGHKDDDGVKIYEGDIASLVLDDIHQGDGKHMAGIRKVVYSTEYAEFYYDQYVPLGWTGWKSRKIIGNVHQNPKMELAE